MRGHDDHRIRGAHMKEHPTSRVGIRTAIALSALALAVRIVPHWAHVVTGAEAVIRDPDAAYHLRRAALIAAHFPDLAVFDSYIDYPRGAHVIWPPLYDIALAGAMRLFPAAPDAPGASVAVALLPPVLFALTILVLVLFARRLWPERPYLAALAAGAPAVLPATFAYTRIGQLDHHAAELLAVAFFLHALARGREQLAGGAGVARAALLPALALAAALATQLSLVVLIAIAFVTILVAPPSTWRRAFAHATWLYALAAVVLLPAASAYARAGAPLRHYQFGLFHPALLALAALASLAAAILAAGGGRRRRALLALIPALLFAALAARLGGETAGGIAYIFRQYAPWQETIGESQSLFAPGIAAGAAALATRLSLLALALPLAWPALARRALAGDPRRAILLVASALFAALGLTQARFLPHLALFVGMAAATAVELVIARPPRAPRHAAPRRAAMRPAASPPVVARAAASALALALALLPTLRGYGRDEEPDRTYDRARSVLEYLARSTPATSFYERPTRMPEYGVVAEWSFGHYIQRVGRRPAVVDNFGDHAGDPRQVERFFLATDERSALAYLDSVGARYVLVRDLAAGFQGLIPDAAVRARFVRDAVFAAPGRARIEFAPAIAGTMLYRLSVLNGGGAPSASDTAATPLSRLRLVAESEALDELGGGTRVAAIKLYAVVRGARLAVTGFAPDEDAALLAAVTSPRGRRFPYVALLRADALGALAITLPYPTSSPGAAAGASHFSDLHIATRSGRFALPPIDEAAVRDGRTIALARPALEVLPPPR
jgi:dolichyl-diphosphooligosaccharide--protein glycosyltransferase